MAKSVQSEQRRQKTGKNEARADANSKKRDSIHLVLAFLLMTTRMFVTYIIFSRSCSIMSLAT
jgi:hypothetical protein